VTKKRSRKASVRATPRTPTRVKAPAQTVVAGVGASAGGLEALQSLFRAMPLDTGLGFVLVQHLDPTRRSLTAELLGKATEMPVVEVIDRMRIEPDHVYVLPPNRLLAVRRGTLRTMALPERHGPPLPVDFLFRSLAEDETEKAIGIILSGTGSDGALGLKAIKAQGGLMIAQQPEQARYDGMPRSAIATGQVDYVLPVEEMPTHLVRYVRHAYFGGGTPPAAQVAQAPDQLSKVLALLRAQTRYDFRYYKKSMVLRRIIRRMGLRHIERPAAYLDLLRASPDEGKALLKDLLIGVTSFFRDPEAFKVLAEKVIPPLIAAHEPDTSLRVWVPGCASGEEAYSLAILLLEQLATAHKSCPVQIFATDIDAEALEVGRAGIYPDNIAHDVSPQRLQRFFTQHANGYHVSKALRDAVVFAVQNLIGDPPFSKLDLVSCRNLLIYLEPEMQQRLIPLFHFALNAHGCLLLGTSETVGQQDHLFERVSQKSRIFRRIGPARAAPADLPLATGVGHWGTDRARARVAVPAATNPGQVAKDLLLTGFTPVAVLINRKREILYFHGATTRYLDQPSGAPTNDLLSLVRAELRTQLRAALQKAVREQRRISVAAGTISNQDGNRRVSVTVTPVEAPAELAGLLLVTFADEVEPDMQVPVSEPGTTDAAVIRQLEHELKTMRDDLHNTIDQLECANEELKASNEEATSLNEEFQSTNEELEASKEELQTLNEELTTVNHQLQAKVAELENANNDLANLLTSTDIATIFLDTQFCIKRFSPATTRLLHLIPTDIGRPLRDIAGKLRDDDLLRDAQRVLDKLTPVEKEVRADDWGWFIRRALPYRTRDNKIDGVVVTFSDVTQLKHAEQAAQAAREHAESILETVREALVVLDGDLRVVSANRCFYETFQVTPAQARGRPIFEVGELRCDHSRLRALLKEILPQRTAITDFELGCELPSGGQRILVVNGRRMRRSADRPETILLAFEDITERRAAQEKLRQAERLAAIGTFAAGVAHEINNPLASMLITAQQALHAPQDLKAVKLSLREIVEDIERCSRVVKSVRSFARQEAPEKRRVDLNDVVQDVARAVQQYARQRGVRLHLRLGRGLPPLPADATELAQALINIVYNALEASRKGQTVAVRTGIRQQALRVTVQDQGRGMTAEERQHVFDPFYTTRDKEGGTGLGLSLAHATIRRHDGTIRLKSKLGQGTSVVVELPLKKSTDRKARRKSSQRR
jgi:two-component system CheB/CheR fusion protein